MYCRGFSAWCTLKAVFPWWCAEKCTIQSSVAGNCRIYIIITISYNGGVETAAWISVVQCQELSVNSWYSMPMTMVTY